MSNHISAYDRQFHQAIPSSKTPVIQENGLWQAEFAAPHMYMVEINSPDPKRGEEIPGMIRLTLREGDGRGGWRGEFRLTLRGLRAGWRVVHILPDPKGAGRGRKSRGIIRLTLREGDGRGGWRGEFRLTLRAGIRLALRDGGRTAL